MKKIITNLAILFCITQAQSTFAYSEKIVFIDLDRTFNAYYKTKLADGQLKEQADTFNKERKDLVQSYELLESEF